MKRARKIIGGLCLLVALLCMSGYRTEAAEMNVQVHTPDEIRSYIQQSGATVNDPVTYLTKPNTNSPYNAGTLSDKTLQGALGMLNQIRYIAGLEADVTLDTGYNELAQAAALVNAANGQLSHFPDKPSGMPDTLYGLGSRGASSCNLGMGYATLGGALLNGWMYDGDSSNIDRVGHRRWILNPSMKKTGFGYAGNYSALYVFDMSGDSACTNVAWPAQNMPLEYFSSSCPWSFSTGVAENMDAICVTIVRQRDQKKWIFSKTASNGYFNVDNAYYGQSGCIIFRPDSIAYQDGDSFDITITGTQAGTISYKVNFFGLTDMSQMEARQPKLKSVTKQSATSIKITWQREETADGYIIYLSNSANSGYKKIKTITNGQTTSLVKKNLDSKKTYYVKIKAYVEQYGKTYYSKESDYIKIQMKTVSAKPKATAISKITAKKKGFTVKWKKQTSQTTGYEIAYSTNKKFLKKRTAVVTIPKNKTSSTTVSGLKAKKKYYVRIRTYQSTKANGKTNTTYSSWSTAKTVTTKK